MNAVPNYVRHRKSSGVSVLDQFCGAGGSSIGATAAGADVVVALNHWKRAIETHSQNFPQTYHECTDISAVDPRRYPSTNVLITSPECTNHALSKGVSRKRQQLDLWGVGPKPEAERSRATMFDVCRFAEFHDYELIIVENVVEARKWIFWDSWIHAMTVSLEYDYEVVYFNSMFAHPVPQSRDRMYTVFWKRKNKKPDLEFTPLAFCFTCGKNVNAVQCWKKPSFKWGKYRSQYTYNCPDCAKIIEPYYYCAANAIDWKYPIERISDRKRPLEASTMRRIEMGLKKFVYEPFLASLDQSNLHRNIKGLMSDVFPTQTTSTTMGMTVPSAWIFAPGSNGLPKDVTTDPMPTAVTQAAPMLTISPFLVDSGGVWESPPADVLEPYPTQTVRRQPGVVMPFYVQVGHGGPENGSRVRPVTDPLNTQHTLGGSAVAMAPFTVGLSYGTSEHSYAHSASEPYPTQTARQNIGVTMAPFLMQYNGNSEGLIPVHEAIPTQTSRHRQGVVLAPDELPTVEDCYFRTVRSHEVQKAMGFPDTYVITGTEREKVHQCGNAVTAPVMTMLLSRGIETLKG